MIYALLKISEIVLAIKKAKIVAKPLPNDRDVNSAMNKLIYDEFIIVTPGMKLGDHSCGIWELPKLQLVRAVVVSSVLLHKL